ncbi:MAG: Calx-beta domain-containing protein, partial [Maribacter dokdonensis]
MKLKHFMLTAALASFILTSCSDDDDMPTPGTIGIATTEDNYDEGEGTVGITISTTSVNAMDVTINYEVTGTATEGEDYQSLSGSVVLPAGETSIQESLILIDDTEVESSEEVIFTITSTSNEEDIVGANSSLIVTITDNDSYPFENGILVSHEGNFMQGNASISFVSDDLATVENDIFKTVNDADALGDNAQSMSFYENMAYIVMNGSQKIEVVNRYTF